jgi:hypothetical protein
LDGNDMVRSEFFRAGRLAFCETLARGRAKRALAAREDARRELESDAY